MGLCIDEKIILLNLKAADSAGVISQMGECVLKAGLVREDFIEAVIRREQKYPTALPTKIPVALCHTDAEYLLGSFIGAATLAEPVPFREMGNSEHWQPVEIVFLLGIAVKGEHMDVLKSVLKLIQDETMLQAIRAAESTAEIKKILAGYLMPESAAEST
jgi:PTS system galactitol-specific IIA component